MASDALRKKWGTIFMGDKEATMEQLDAMQEPALRERIQKDQEKAYLERVKQRACDRAREILGQAYTERQEILTAAQNEAQSLRERLLQDCEVLKAEAQKIKAEAQAELERAKKVSQDAQHIKNTAEDAGYQAGMEQASKELREFRADLGNEMGQVLLAIGKQLHTITTTWREDLVDLMRQAVVTGTGWVIDHNYETILRSLVMQALNLLEEREVVTLRVNPEDEAIISDLFRAAREKAPELKQWIVNGDETIERGGLVAESGSGSVDLQRKNYRDLVAEILEHLALPAKDTDQVAEQKIQQQACAVASKFTAEPTPQQKAPTPEVELASPMLQEDVAMVPKENPKENQKEKQKENSKESQKDLVQEAPKIAAQEAAPEEAPAQVEAKPKEQPVSQEQKASKVAELANLEGEFELPDDVFAVGTDVEEPQANSLAALEEELFPVGQDEESQVLANGGFLPDLPEPGARS
ncbi:MAG: flagellar assembly protein FliH [Desulfovibrionaceae bacterium]|nr:flagellar assembly protein FliH [Desulfovibrionaceae bacterium]